MMKQLVKNDPWVAHAYPLQQLTIRLQGTRNDTKDGIISQLKTVLARLEDGDKYGHDHDDDFGYAFEYQSASQGPSFFDLHCGYK
jgi:hypothetical protein